MRYIVVERKVEFKTVEPRWEPFKICDTLEEAEAVVAMFTPLIDGYIPFKGAGKITEYRIKEVESHLI